MVYYCGYDYLWDDGNDPPKFVLDLLKELPKKKTIPYGWKPSFSRENQQFQKTHQLQVVVETWHRFPPSRGAYITVIGWGLRTPAAPMVAAPRLLAVGPASSPDRASCKAGDPSNMEINNLSLSMKNGGLIRFNGILMGYWWDTDGIKWL